MAIITARVLVLRVHATLDLGELLLDVGVRGHGLVAVLDVPEEVADAELAGRVA